MPVEEADQIARAAREAIHRVVGGAYCVIHIDPARPRPVAADNTVTVPGIHYGQEDAVDEIGTAARKSCVD